MTARRRWTLALGPAAVLLLAIPIVAYVVVPVFVRSRVDEPAPRAAILRSAQATPSAPVASAPASSILLAGDLRRINTVDFGRGHVSVLQAGEQRFLRFENVEIAAAPVQHVYLSDRSDGAPGNFTDLGSLKATSGSFNYEVPPGLDLRTVHSVVAWCKQFNTTVTYAVLSAP